MKSNFVDNFLSVEQTDNSAVLWAAALLSSKESTDVQTGHVDSLV